MFKLTTKNESRTVRFYVCPKGQEYRALICTAHEYSHGQASVSKRSKNGKSWSKCPAQVAYYLVKQAQREFAAGE